jgi:hypothetical protein
VENAAKEKPPAEPKMKAEVAASASANVTRANSAVTERGVGAIAKSRPVRTEKIARASSRGFHW